MSAAQGPYSDDRGTWFLALGWTLTSLAVTAIALRLYTRLVLTRSAGSDDLAIAFCFGLTIAGQIGDSIAVAHGLGRHQQYLTNSDFASIVKWEFIDLINVFISLFFLRSSIMLFTLRLLPATKIWPQRIIVLAFLLNLAITLIIIVTYGVKCVPFKAIYQDDPTAKCAPQSTVVITQQLNGIIACIIDIATAMIPAFLLWKIRIKKSTKIILDVIFLCGLVTAGLSIGRAATTNTGIWKEDTSWRIQPPNTFSMVEEKAGIVIACCPALRQLVVHVIRTRTVLPRKRPPNSEEDFIKMRKKVKLRDIFWYRKPKTGQLATFTGAPVYPPESDVDPHTHRRAEAGAKRSPLDLWKTSLGAVFGRRKAMQRLASHDQAVPRVEVEEPKPELKRTSTRPAFHSSSGSWPGAGSEAEQKRIEQKYRDWDLPPYPSKLRNATPRPTQSAPSFSRLDVSDGNASELMGSTLAGSSKHSQSAHVTPADSSVSSTKRVPRPTKEAAPRVDPSSRTEAVNFSRLRRQSPPSSRISLREALVMEKRVGDG